MRFEDLDPLLMLVADDETEAVTIADPDLDWLHHAYDGGADVIGRSPTHREQLRERHHDWLPLGSAS
jgi:hypothetical protein